MADSVFQHNDQKVSTKENKRMTLSKVLTPLFWVDSVASCTSFRFSGKGIKDSSRCLRSWIISSLAGLLRQSRHPSAQYSPARKHSQKLQKKRERKQQITQNKIMCNANIQFQKKSNRTYTATQLKLTQQQRQPSFSRDPFTYPYSCSITLELKKKYISLWLI